MPKVTYYALIFTSTRTDVTEGYLDTNDLLMIKAANYAGFLGQDAVREEIGIAGSYWKTMEDIHAWKNDMHHLLAKSNGKSKWCRHFRVRIAKVEMDYESHSPNED